MSDGSRRSLRDRLFPAPLARLSPRHTPWISYLVMGTLASILLVLNFSRGLVAASGMETVYWVFLLIMLGLPVYVVVGRGSMPAGRVSTR